MDSNTALNVSRETLDRLRSFEALTRKWTQKINLVSHSTQSDIWDRHILDSGQLYQYAPAFKNWVDLGSGGGFPGIVMAIYAAADNPDATVTLIESDLRKSTFLRTAIKDLSLNAQVISARIEVAAPQCADVVSARALGSLSVLFPYVVRHLAPHGTALLMKGARYAEEIDALDANWTYELMQYPSMTNPESRILSFQRISRVAEV